MLHIVRFNCCIFFYSADVWPWNFNKEERTFWNCLFILKIQLTGIWHPSNHCCLVVTPGFRWRPTLHSLVSYTRPQPSITSVLSPCSTLMECTWLVACWFWLWQDEDRVPIFALVQFVSRCHLLVLTESYVHGCTCNLYFLLIIFEGVLLV